MKSTPAESLPLDPLTALAPLDGRYADKVTALRPLFSEFGLIRHRVQVEIAWLMHLADDPGIAELAPFSSADRAWLQAIGDDFSVADARAVKAIEANINHDVKAVEYFLRERLTERGMDASAARYVHFACTSEDINNLAYALAARTARDEVLLPELAKIEKLLAATAAEHADTPMLSRTHGQSASPTTLGKEWANVLARLRGQRDSLRRVPIRGKMNGAVGNFNAHYCAYPEIDWPASSERFLTGLGVTPNLLTTQIEPHDWMAEYFDAVARINTVLIDFCRDVWGYVSVGYLRQRSVAGEVGSSTMPHKVNPIDFENAEGNFGCANALLGHLSGKLPISRWQRDLTDSTVLRNCGMALGWGLAGYRSLAKGLGRIEVAPDALALDLAANPAVLAEAVQTVMKRYGIDDAYEKLKALTRGEAINLEQLHKFVAGLDIPEEARDRLRALAPSGYTGTAGVLARRTDLYD